MPGPIRCRVRRELGVVIEEADETAFWLELVGEAGEIKSEKLNDLIDEARQLGSHILVREAHNQGAHGK